MTDEIQPLNTTTGEEDVITVVPKKKKKLPIELIKIDLPPPPEDVCKVCDPLVESDMKLAITSTICCWCPMGCLPAVFGFSAIYYACKAQNAKTDEERLEYSRKSQNISWIGMILFMGIMIIGIVIMATCGVL